MTLVHPRPPKGGSEQVILHLDSLLRRGPEFLAQTPLAGVDPGSIALADPHRTYVIDIVGLASGADLALARADAWRYLLVAGERALGDVELIERHNHTFRFAGLHFGCWAEDTICALRAAEAHEELRHRRMEIRYLKAPPLGFCAVWLRPSGAHTAPDGDVLVPIHRPGAEDTLAAVEPLVPVPMKQVRPVLSARARELLAGA